MYALYLLSLSLPALALACRGEAIYVSSNQAKNTVVALSVHKNGTLNHQSVTETGGAGSAGFDTLANATAGPDALFSQSALTVAGKHLFAVNAGSNSLSMFRIHSPTNLSLIDKVDVPGEFPVTVGASSEHKLVCVGMSGATAGVSCASFSDQGLEDMDELRPFDLAQTTPPKGPFNTVSQVFFNGNTVFTTVKGDPTKNNTGFLASFDVQNGSVASCGKQVSPPGTAVLFGSAPIDDTHLFVTDASFGAANLDLTVPTVGVTKGVVADQKATCWTAINHDTKTAFVTDVGLNRIIEMSFDAKILNTINLATPDPGLIDLQVGGDFVYALSPGNGTTPAAISVVDSRSKQLIQHLQLPGVLDSNAQGLTILKSSE